MKNNARTRLILPPLDLSSLTTPQMDFWYGTSYGYYKFNVLYKSAATSSWIVLKTYQNTTINSWVHDTIVLPNNTSDSRVAFEVIENNGSTGLNIDDVTIRESAVNCAPPLSPQTTAWGDSAQVSWLTQLYSPTYDIEYGTPGFSHGNGTTISNISDTTYTIAGLSPSTSYDWYVKKNCSGTSSSLWTGPINFTTTTAPYSLPVTEDFESGFVKFGNASGNSVDFTLNTSLKHGGSKSAHNAYSDFNTNYLIMNSYVDLSKTAHPYLTFWHIAKTEGGNDYCKVQISTDNGSSWRTLPTSAYEGSANNYSAWQRFDENSYSTWGGNPADNTWWKNEKYSLENFKGQRVKIRFKLSSDNSITKEGWYIDDITIDDNTCPGIYPDSLWTQNITATTAQLKWKEKGSATAWDIEYGNAGFTQGTGVTISGTSTNPYSLSPLTASTDYDWYVRSLCGGGSYSEWSGPESFSTPCNPSNLPYFENFENVTTPNLPSCMTVEDANNDGVKWQTQSAYGYSGNGTVFVGTPANKSSDDWFFTPGFLLQAGVSYELAFVYSSVGGHESLEIKYGDYPDISSMNSTVIWSNNDITNWSFTLGKADITPATTGTYYFGFHTNSPIGSGGIYLDDIYVNLNSVSATWSGSVDSSWYITGNWNSDTIPTSLTDVSVSPNAVNFPTLTQLSLAKNFTLESNASGNASLLGEQYLKTSGQITVKQFVSSGKWHQLSSPIDSAVVNDLFFNHNPDVWLLEYNEPDDSWSYITSLTKALTPATGFMVWIDANNDTTFSFAGNLNSQDYYLDGSQWSTPQLFYSGTAHGYNMVGNPYASALDWDGPGWDTTGIDGSIWVWNPTAGNYAYRNSQGQGSLANGIIPRSQSFFIKTNNANMYFTIPMSARVHSNQPYYKAKSADELPYLVIDAVSGDKSDELWVSFDDSNTEAYESGRDVLKFSPQNNDAPQLWFARQNDKLSLLAVPMIYGGTRIENISFKAGISGTQQLNLKACTIPDNTKIFLEDLALGSYFDFKKNPVYKFEATTYQAPERFRIHFINSALGIGQTSGSGIANIYADSKGTIYVIRNNKNTRQPATVMVFDITGRKVAETTASGQEIKLQINETKGIYIVKLIESNMRIVKKVFTGKTE